MKLLRTLGFFGLALLHLQMPLAHGADRDPHSKEPQNPCAASLVRGLNETPRFQPAQFVAQVRKLAANAHDVATLKDFVNYQIALVLHQIESLPQRELADRMRVEIHGAISKVGYLPGLSPRSAPIESLDKMILDFSEGYGDILGNVWANVIAPIQVSYYYLEDGETDFFIEDLEPFAHRLEAVAVWEVVRRQVSRGTWTYFENQATRTAFEAVRLRSDFSTNPLIERDGNQSLFPNDPKK